ncbi:MULTISPECIES: Gfo/Idh/MocA family oxidoreductase [unclassified Crossiella]|uniref:Gfo/Idh/MocA family oxidoreductase n=1 Tax=unclassified Crossiella TaxID=2620835 RepID=UPI001FFE82E1|nr:MULTISPECIES: Gfo/Idh/MocA family oxidoreductase [unclassified Crossiella]MCK2241558.1 Gfo/Idh/MocA family oxidoreductase [Crossiella sp. S99.2]MCK2255570.1 Gfo/Idh/MocA family oxidoreductase [Crossiella sp. S99.1]
MLQTFVVGLGRAGAELHLPILLRARESGEHPRLFDPGPVIACDTSAPETAPAGVVVAGSIAEAAAQLEPIRAVVHLCTPPTSRPTLLAELADHGFRKIIVEKPLATSIADLARLSELRQRRWLDLVVVAQWQSSALTQRLEDLVRGGQLGPLRRISMAQHKSRFRRSLASAGHPTAFDVELPHSVGVALRLAGRAELVDSGATDLVSEGRTRTGLGGAWLTLQHGGGVRTEITSSLTSPVRERRITLSFDGGEAVGHYPVSADDHHAQLSVRTPERVVNLSFPDDSLTAFLLHTYRRYQRQAPSTTSLVLQCEVVRLLAEAKARAGLTEPEPPLIPPARTAELPIHVG